MKEEVLLGASLTHNKCVNTATPVHNGLEELWTLLNFLVPEVFPASDDFHRWFSAAGATAGEPLDQEEELLLTSRLHQARCNRSYRDDSS